MICHTARLALVRCETHHRPARDFAVSIHCFSRSVSSTMASSTGMQFRCRCSQRRRFEAISQ